MTAILKSNIKKDLLAHNGRPPKICSICNKETSIPKGEKDYPTYHKKCYTDNRLNGDITNTIDRRIKRYESLKDRIFQFYGKQEEVFDYLLNS
jgi:hypothetical protein